MVQNIDDKHEIIQSLEEQDVALLFTLLAGGLSLYANYGLIDLVQKGHNSSFTVHDIQMIAEISALILLIVAIYFVLLTSEVYEEHTNPANRNYLLAAYFTLSAAALRYFTLKRYPNSFSGVEDIF